MRTDPALRRLPSVDSVLRHYSLREALSTYRRDVITRLVREALQAYRAGAAPDSTIPTAASIGQQVQERVNREWACYPQRVINGTGVILHTNLARAPLSLAARTAMDAAAGYSDLEFDRRTGERGDRQTAISSQLCALTGAEAAHVTVSASAAVLLMLAALTRGREVIVSRGQAVEIGGGFRLPHVLRQSGARLVEVGTTNRTRVADYEEAITERTAALLHVHASNFRMIGFTESVGLFELASLAHRHSLPLLDDNGSGSFIDTARHGIAHEPMVQESLAAGSDLVAFSGDKLFGGPQAGILLGREALIARLRKHPLARAVRPDKIALAALSATALAYLQGNAEQTVPVWRMISQSSDELRSRSTEMQRSASAQGLSIELVDGESTVGGGSLPGETMPTTLMILPRFLTAAKLRALDRPIIARTHAGRTLIDLRTVEPEEEPALLAALLTLAHGRGETPSPR